jgi:hypothetical protein
LRSRSRTSVMASENSSEPRQPRRLEKKTNTNVLPGVRTGG